MRRKHFALAFFLAGILTYLTSHISRHITQVDYREGWPFVIRMHSTDGLNGPIVHESWTSIEKLILNYLFYISLAGLLIFVALKLTQKSYKVAKLVQ